VVHREFDGFAAQKNFGIEKAKYDWVLILDGDERVDDALALAINELPDKPKEAAFNIAFLHYLGRKWLGHGGLYPDYHLRLFNRKHARYEGREVHEELKVKGETGTLAGHLIHLTYRDAKQYLEKVKKYSVAQAQEDRRLKRIKKRRVPLKAALGEFVYRYIKLDGWKDGWAGLVSATLLGYYQWLYWKEIGR
jgi:glycosyltransferase involved in cell wall biosynthesis